MADDGLSRLTDDEKTALLALLKRTINDDSLPAIAANRPAARHSGEAAAAETGAGISTAAAALRLVTRHGKAAASARLARPSKLPALTGAPSACACGGAEPAEAPGDKPPTRCRLASGVEDSSR